MFITELRYTAAENKCPEHSNIRKWLSYKIVTGEILQSLKITLQMKNLLKH